MLLLLKFTSDDIKTASDVRQFFNTFVNDTLQNPIKLVLDQDQEIVYFPTIEKISDPNLSIIEVDRFYFEKKLAANEIRFELDNHHIKLTIVRGMLAGSMTQFHANNLRDDLKPKTDNVENINIDWSAQAIGASCLVPIAILSYLAFQYGYHYYQTGQCLQWNDPIFRQMLNDSASLGIQTLFVMVSCTLARVAIPFLLHLMNLQPSGPLVHFAIAPIFGLIFATSLLIYDLAARKMNHGQLTGSPYKRFYKNFVIGIGLYSIQLIPGLSNLSGVEEICARSACAFAVPNAANLVTTCFSSLKTQGKIKIHTANSTITNKYSK